MKSVSQAKSTGPLLQRHSLNCIGTRAVYLDLVSLRGYPSKIYSNNGAQLVAASQELRNVMKSWDWEKLKSFGVMEGF